MRNIRKSIHSLISKVACGAALLAAAGAAWSQVPQASNKEALAGVKEMKIAFDITEGNPTALLTKLSVIDLTRKQLIAEGVTPRMVVAFRGDASFFTQTDMERIKPEEREAAKKVAEKIREIRGASGVESMVQCSVPLPSRKLRGEDVMPELKLVGNGWISLVSYQQKGYAYIAP
jgi:intracellular sulfur oxidation DsrE/DsrF family protein